MKRKFREVVTALTMVLGISFPAAMSCCSMFPAKFTSTIGYAGEGRHDGQIVHVLGYQNTAQNDLPSGANALFLPIPAQAGTMRQTNILDTSKYKNVLTDIKNAIPVSVPRGATFGKSKASPQAAAIVFEHDIYTIVLAPNAKAIPEALAKVPAAKRPAMNNAIFEAYDKWYPGWTFALCCFNTKEKKEAAPMVWWYQPLYKDKLFFPALDAHSGKPPDLNANVDVDHTLAFGSVARKLPQGSSNPVRYRDVLPKNVKDLFPPDVTGDQFQREMKNGDFWLNLSTFETKPEILRQSPPGAPKPTVSR